MSISIVIAAYNAEKFLAETLDSVVAQTYPDWELIITDDGSTDGTVALIERYCARDRRIRLICQPNAGAGAARNNGIQNLGAHSEYVIFFDADDVWNPDTLQTLLTVLEQSPTAVGVHALASYIDAQSEPIYPGKAEAWGRERWSVSADGRASLTPTNSPTDFNVLAVHNVIITPGVLLLRRTVIEQTGLFDTSFGKAEDWDMWLRVARQGPILFLDRSVMKYRKHSGNKSGDSAKLRRTDRLIRSKHLFSKESTPEQKRLLLAAYRFVECRHGRDKLGYARACLARRQMNTAFKQCGYAIACYIRSLQGLSPRPYQEFMAGRSR